MMADIHCHILPYVDDGAEHLAETEQILIEQAKQGVRLVCATPHLRPGMFETPDAEIFRQFNRARDFVQKQKLPIHLCLSREYYCNTQFLKRLQQGNVLPMGGGKYLLVEFSRRSSFKSICDILWTIISAGYRPLVAHVERYPAFQENIDQFPYLIKMGVAIQINAGGVLGREGHLQKQFCWKLMNQDLVHVVASDAHGPVHRPVELEPCAQKIESRMGPSYAQLVLWENPLKIVSL